MTDKQNKDNLEQFFKKNLENYSPEPANNFWDRLEPAIPAKPDFWGTWSKSIRKIVSGTLLFGIIALCGITWYSDHQKVKELSNVIAKQRIQLKNEENINSHESNPTFLESQNNLNLNNQETRIANKIKGEEKNELTTNNINSNNLEFNSNYLKNNLNDKKNNSLFSLANNTTQATPAKNTIYSENINSTIFSDNALKATIQSVFVNEIAKKENIDKIKLLPLNFLTTKQNTPSVDSDVKKVLNPFARLSIEAGASVFMQPVGLLFSDSSNFNPGKTNLSSGGGLLFNFEINRAWLLQSGFYYKNIKSSNLSMKYNCFPFAVRKKYGYGLKKHLEIKLGVCLNSLISATNNEGIPIPGLKKAYVDILTSAAYTFRLAENINFIVEPNAGYSLSPIVDNKRSINFGLYTGIRYSFFIKPF
ncbi:MAG: hypothetical protein R2825_17725 [Saprospiraceae bacterium]